MRYHQGIGSGGGLLVGEELNVYMHVCVWRDVFSQLFSALYDGMMNISYLGTF